MGANPNQHIIVKQANGNHAATSYGPRTTTKRVPLHRPVRAEERQIVLQLDGDEFPVLTADFADDALSVLRKGDFVIEVAAYSDTGAAVALSLEDRNAVVTALPPVAPAAGEWAIARDADISITETTQITGGVGAGETAVVRIKYLSAESMADGGVLHRTRDNALVADVDFLDPDGDGLPGPAQP